MAEEKPANTAKELAKTIGGLSDIEYKRLGEFLQATDGGGTACVCGCSLGAGARMRAQ